ncbi:MAG: DJ-1/PfpI family protein [Thermoanaerobaculia bacterium]|jgi:transcriptional regulator GlxA family with amidase domain
MKRIMAIALLLFAAESALAAERYTRNVAIVLYNGVEVLDWAGPAEVFAAASHIAPNGSDYAFNVYAVSKTRAPIVSQGFVDVTPDYAIADAPAPDIIVLPGGGTGSVTGDPEWMAWVKTSVDGAENVLTVCTGAFVVGKLGGLDGLDVTTWYAAVPQLAEQFPNADVQPGRRFIDNGKVITTAGVSAGIDGSLHLVAKTLGRWVADRTAEYMEYAWAPQSYSSSKYPQLNPRLDARGRRLQEAAIAARSGDVDRAVTIHREILGADAGDATAWMSLGNLLHESKRYREAAEAFGEAAKSKEQRAGAFYNQACSYALGGDREKALGAVGNAIEAGFSAKGSLETDPDLASIRDDTRFKQLAARL